MKKVVIVGAGPAGLTAAYKLLKDSNKYEVIILEKDSLVGGISKSINFDNYIVDTGIHRFFSRNDEVNTIWKELLPLQSKLAYDDKLLNRKINLDKDGIDPNKEDNVLLVKNRVTRILYDNKFYDYPVSMNMNTIKNLGFINILAAGFSYLKALIFKKKETNLENFYINRFGKKLYNMFFESYTEKVWGIHPSKIDASWGSQRVKGLSIRKVLLDMINKKRNKKNLNNTETSLIESFYYPKKGCIAMYEKMRDEIIKMGGSIILDAEVNKIHIKNNTIKSIDYLKNNKIVNEKCDYLISSMPIKDLISNMDINVPKNIYNYATKLPYRSFMSVVFVLDKLNLKNETNIKTINNIVPDSWIYIQEKNVSLGRIQIFNNWSPYIFPDLKSFKKDILISFEYFCDENDKYWNMKKEDFIKFAKEEGIKLNLFKEDNIKKAYQIKIPKAYPAYFGTYKYMPKIEKYIDSFNNLYCIGRNGEHKYNNMDHSMLTGITVSDVIINNLDKKIIWDVNTEKCYNEEK